MPQILKTRSLFILFFISGFTALVFEVVWARQALLIFGNTTLANAAVIAAFMTGLALGSHVFGKLADTRVKNPVGLYAVLEAGIGVFAIFFPLLVRILDPVYRVIYASFQDDFITLSLVRFALSFVVLIVPTTLMGGTLPLLSRFLSREAGTLKENLSKLYAMNLFGAMTGAFLAGFVLIASIGLQRTAVLAALFNLGIYAYVRWRLRPAEQNVSADATSASGVASSDEEPEPPAEKVGLVMGLLAVHGFAAFVIQICWTRTVALVLGSSTYAFSAMLTTFLAGLGLGTWAVAKMARMKIKPSLTFIGYLEIAVGASVILFIPVFEWMIFFFVKLFPFVQKSVLATFSVQFLICALSMIVPTFLMGLVFPSILLFLGRPRDIGRIVGRAYAVNTIGGVAGCVLAGFLFISRFGVNGSLKLAALLSIAAGIAVVFLTTERVRWKAQAVRSFFAVALPALFLFYPWDKHMFSSGAFIYADTWSERAELGKALFQKILRGNSDIIYYKDGISSTVTVIQHDSPGKKVPFKSKSLRVNGKTDASTVGDMGTQLYLGYIPLFAHPEPNEVLVVGLGAGVTLGTVTQFPSVKSVECVEIEPAVVEANRFFSAENNYALKDPRVRMIIGDGRNHIRYSPKKYDVIISEPSNPWISGISNLFSVENYQEAIGKLSEDGIYCQWFHSYQMSVVDFQMIIKTFASVFPEVNLFRVGNNDYFLLGSRKPISFNNQRMHRLIASNKFIRSDLQYFSEHDEHFVIGAFMLSNRDLRRGLSQSRAPLNTDDHLLLEYNAPKGLYRKSGVPIFEWLHSFPRQDVFPHFEDWDAETILSSENIWKVLFKKGLDQYRAGNYKASLELFRRAWKLKPDEAGVYYEIGRSHEALGRFELAVRYYGALAKISPDRVRQLDSAVKRAQLIQKIEQNPIFSRNAEYLNLIGVLSYFAGDREGALRWIERAIDADPRFAKNYAALSIFHFFSGDFDEGIRMLEKAEKLDRGDEEAQRARRIYEEMAKSRTVEKNLTAARFYLAAGDLKKARKSIEDTFLEDPENILAYAMLSLVEEKSGRPEEAQRLKVRAAEILKASQRKKEPSKKD